MKLKFGIRADRKTDVCELQTMVTRSLLFIFLFSLSLCNLKRDYASRLKAVPLIFQNIFDCSLTQKELVEYYTKQMGKIAGQNFYLGTTLSDVLFNYFTYNIFTRKSGKEISEQDFLKELKSKLDILVSSNSDEEIEAMKKEIISNANGLIKSSRSFDAPGLVLGGQMVKSIINSNPDLPEKNKTIISELSQFFSKTIPNQKAQHNELEIFKQNSKDIFNVLIYDLVLASYLPNVDLMAKQMIRLRILELAEVLRILFHYDKLDTKTAVERNENLMSYLAKLKAIYDTEFKERNSQKLFQLSEIQVSKALSEEDNFLELLKISKKDSMKAGLSRLRLQLP